VRSVTLTAPGVLLTPVAATVIAPVTVAGVATVDE